MNSVTDKKVSAVSLLILFMGIWTLPLWAADNEKIERMEFYDMPIIEILISLAKKNNISIIPDDTISGNTTFVFFDKTIDEALDLFVATHDLYLTRKTGIYYVSKINVEYDDERNWITMDAEDVNLRVLIDAIAKAIDKSIYYDPLPTLTPPVHANRLTPAEVLQMLLVMSPDYTLDVNPNYFYIRHIPPSPGPGGSPDGTEEETVLTKNGEFYTINKKKQRFLDLVHDLFNRDEKEYTMLMKRDVMLEVVKYKNKRFEEMLRLILEQANADYYVSETGNYYIFEISQRDILKDFKEYEYIPLQYISPNDFQRIIPPDLGNSKYFRTDPNTNSIILSGSKKETEPIRKFIEEIDKPLAGNKYYRYDLDFIKAGNIKSMLPNKYRQMEIITLPDTNSIIMLLTPAAKRYMDEYLGVLDKTVDATEITLKYIKSEELMKNLPPAVNREDISVTEDPSIIFFKGTEDKLKVFQKQLDIFDKPVPQIRYEVLVLSYSEDEGLNWSLDSSDAGVTLFMEEGTERFSFVGALSQILKLNFDIPSVLGIGAALNLNLALSNSQAKVMTDTTIYGVSGEKINFNDTETHRYRTEVADSGDDDDTVGTIEEVQTGFQLDIEGWVSGDNMITMNVDISISKEGSKGEDSSSGSLGSTFEKDYSTTVRCPSGQAFKVGGLIKQDKNEIISKIPVLGDIPFLGVLFQKKTEDIRKSEIVVYILPHIETPIDALEDTSLRLGNLYTKYMGQPKFKD